MTQKLKDERFSNIMIYLIHIETLWFKLTKLKTSRSNLAKSDIYGPLRHFSLNKKTRLVLKKKIKKKCQARNQNHIQKYNKFIIK